MLLEAATGAAHARPRSRLVLLGALLLGVACLVAAFTVAALDADQAELPAVELTR